METSKKVTVETTVQAPVEKVWEYWTEPTHITKWNRLQMTGTHPLLRMI